MIRRRRHASDGDDGDDGALAAGARCRPRRHSHSHMVSHALASPRARAAASTGAASHAASKGLPRRSIERCCRPFRNRGQLGHYMRAGFVAGRLPLISQRGDADGGLIIRALGAAIVAMPLPMLADADRFGGASGDWFSARQPARPAKLVRASPARPNKRCQRA